MVDYVEFSVRDYDGDRQQVSLPLAPAATTQQALDIANAYASWSAGANAGAFHRDEVIADLNQSASSVIAQGKLQGIVEITDNLNGRAYNYRIPIPDLAKADDVGTNPAFIVSGGLTVFNPAHADYATLVAAIEAAYQNPATNAAGTVSRIYIEE